MPDTDPIPFARVGIGFKDHLLLGLELFVRDQFDVLGDHSLLFVASRCGVRLHDKPNQLRLFGSDAVNDFTKLASVVKGLGGEVLAREFDASSGKTFLPSAIEVVKEPCSAALLKSRRSSQQCSACWQW